MSQNKKDRKTKKAQTNSPLGYWLPLVGLVLGIIATLLTIINGCWELDTKIKPTLTPTLTPSLTVTVTHEPTATPLFTPGPIYFIELPTQVNAGNEVTVILQAWQGAICFLEYYTADGNISKADGLGIAIPDKMDRCSWVWRINANTHAGIGKLVIHLSDLEETHDLEVLPPN